MRDIAAFVSSEEGRLYAATCEKWGVDPGAIIEDDVLAINLRVGLASAMLPVPDAVIDPGAAARAGGEKIRRALSG